MLTSFSISEFRRFSLLLVSVLFAAAAHGANRYWIATATANWNTAANWSATSGGAGGAGVPTNLDVVFFDGAVGATGNCIINANVNIINITVSAAYTGTITQNSGITISFSGNSIWAGGTFLGGNSSITNNGTFSLAGGTFSSTTGTLIIRNTFAYTTGSFIHNNGTVDFQNNNFAINGSPIFYHLKNTPSYNTLTINNSFTVAGNFNLNGNGATCVINTAPNVTITVLGNLDKTGTDYVQYNVGSIDVKGNIVVTSSAAGNGGTGTFIISGTGAQQLSSTAAAQFGRLPSITINKPSGMLTLAGTISVGGPNWTHIAGSVDPGTSTLYFFTEPGGIDITIAGTNTLNNVILFPYYSTTTITGNLSVNNFTMDGNNSSVIDIGSSSTVTINGNLYMTGTDQLYIDGGLMNVLGDIVGTNSNVNGGGTGTVQICGTGNQTMSNAGAIGSGKLPNVTINKPSGTLTLSGIISCVGPNWRYISGSLDPTTSTVFFYRVPGGSNINVTGTHTLNNVSISSYYSTATIGNNLTVNDLTLDGSTNHVLSLGSSVLTINGTLSTSGVDPLTINSGTTLVKGNIVYTNSNNGSGGSTTFSICGTGDQNLTGTGIVNRSRLPSNIILSKPSGSLIISGGVPFYFYSAVNFVQGVMVSTAAQLAIFTNAASVTGSPGSACYIDGPVRKIGNSAFTFPIGDNGLYASLRISAPAGATNAFTAEYFNSDPNTSSYSVAVKDATLDHIGRCEHWVLERTTGTPNVSVTLSWDTRSCGVTNLSELRVARWDGAQWRDEGNVSTTGNTTAGTVTSTLCTSFSPFTLASRFASSNPLPITLVAFDGKCKNEGVQLNWITASELNNDYFEVERSSDTETWDVIGKIKSNGSTSTKQTYSLLDKSPLTGGVNYYRLKQVDQKDNGFEHSGIIAVDVCDRHQQDISVYPNPVKSYVTVSTGIEYADLQIEIRDNSGRLIYSQRHNSNLININLSEFENGLYFLTAGSAIFRKSFPVNLLKD